MAKEEKKEPFLSLDEVEYPVSEMTQEQVAIYNHLNDLERKILSSEFNLVQLRFGKQAFVDAFRVSIENQEKEKNEKVEKPEVLEEVPS